MSPASRLFVGLGIPILLVVPTIPLLQRASMVVLGMPVAVLWLFCCIPLCSLCLGTCWWLHDRHQPDEREAVEPAGDRLS